LRSVQALVLGWRSRFRRAGKGKPRARQLLLAAAIVAGLSVVPVVFAAAVPVATIDTCPPVVQLGAAAAFAGSGTASDGHALTASPYSWAFGDGATSTAQSPSHLYAAAGTYPVSFTVSDDTGTSDPDTCSVKVNNPPSANFSFAQSMPGMSRDVSFSASAGDSDGAVASYTWNFGDGTSGSGANVSHTYAGGGTHTVTLTVTDNDGGATQVSHDVQTHSSPTAVISWDPAMPTPGQAVTFKAAATPSSPGKAITSYEWDFSWDGSNFSRDATGATVAHAFGEPGPHPIAMRVTEHQDGTSDGATIVSDTVSVNAPPTADFAVNPAQVSVGGVVTLSSTSSDPDGPLVSQQWDLNGDGKYAGPNAPVVTTHFDTPGVHTVGLRVTDLNGATATVTHGITVVADPVAPARLVVVPGVSVNLAGTLQGRNTVVKRFYVSAPKGATVRLGCKRPVRVRSAKRARVVMRSCGIRPAHVLANGKKLRIRQMERTFRPRTQLTVTVSKPGYIGSVTRFTMRARRQPLREQRCLPPGAKTATKCRAP
jgi:PKD repeat protein